jgi:6-phosphogluconolactonase
MIFMKPSKSISDPAAEILRTDAFVTVAADRILETLSQTLANKDFFVLGLCGGRTPLPVYERIAREGKHVQWERVIVTFGDERCVPPQSDQSNFRAIKMALIERISIPESNVLRVKGEVTPEAAAEDYERQLDSGAEKFKVKSFNHDLLLLGMGDDGHTASLFPGTSALEERGRRVVANYVPKLNAHRITFTIPFINSAERIMLLVNDPAKEMVLKDIFAGRGDYPAGKVKPHSGQLQWIVGGGES